jgi:hypothetical protein
LPIVRQSTVQLRYPARNIDYCAVKAKGLETFIGTNICPSQCEQLLSTQKDMVYCIVNTKLIALHSAEKIASTAITLYRYQWSAIHCTVQDILDTLDSWCDHTCVTCVRALLHCYTITSRLVCPSPPIFRHASVHRIRIGVHISESATH